MAAGVVFSSEEVDSTVVKLVVNGAVVCSSSVVDCALVVRVTTGVCSSLVVTSVEVEAVLTVSLASALLVLCACVVGLVLTLDVDFTIPVVVDSAVVVGATVVII